MDLRLRVPCAFQGGKQRIASQIVDVLLEASNGPDTRFFDLCCGSAAVSIELVNRGIDPSRIFMLDISSWGTFWCAIGSGTFKLNVFEQLLSELPKDKRALKAHVTELSKRTVQEHEAEIYPILQACSFGGKQIWLSQQRWANACFRDFWEPTETSIRRSPANPMQPSASELRRRVRSLVHGMKGVTCLKADIMSALTILIPEDSVVYVDPPYQGSTGYAFGFDLAAFIESFRHTKRSPLFISEGRPLNPQAQKLFFGGSNGGISGNRKGKHEEWLSRF